MIILKNVFFIWLATHYGPLILIPNHSKKEKMVDQFRCLAMFSIGVFYMCWLLFSLSIGVSVMYVLIFLAALEICFLLPVLFSKLEQLEDKQKFYYKIKKLYS
jgi:hypothetical protein